MNFNHYKPSYFIVLILILKTALLFGTYAWFNRHRFFNSFLRISLVLKINLSNNNVHVINSLQPSDAIWRQRSGSTLAQVMTWCLMTPSHYGNQCGLIISEVQWHSSESNSTISLVLKINLSNNNVHVIDSLQPCGAIWRQRSGSTLAEVMTWCLTAPSHYRNQCWFIISEVYWHSSESSFTIDVLVVSH